MSKIGKQPVILPQGVTAEVDSGKILVKGPKGELAKHLPRGIEAAVEDGKILVSRKGNTKKKRGRGVEERKKRGLGGGGGGGGGVFFFFFFFWGVGFSPPVKVEAP